MDALDKALAETATQQQHEWHMHRVGKFTASEIHRLMSEPKKKGETLSGGAKTYVMEKVAERITGFPCKQVDTFATQWGNDHEDEAREMFTLKTGLIVEQIGFVPYGEEAGGSPDGVIPMVKSGIEIKCPFNSANHIDHLLIKSDEQLKADFKEYYWQIQMNILCNEAENWWFVSFDPRFPESQRMFIHKVERNEDDITRIKEKLLSAITFMNEIITTLNIH